MSYTIRYFRDGEHFEEKWRGLLSEAKDMSVGAVAVGGYDRAEIHDAYGQLIFYFPRITRRAEGEVWR